MVSSYETQAIAAQKLGINEGTVSKACSKGWLCAGKYFFSNTPTLPERITPKNPFSKATKKFTITLPPDLWDDFLTCVGQKNKQYVVRRVLAAWIAKEKKKNDKH